MGGNWGRIGMRGKEGRESGKGKGEGA